MSDISQAVCRLDNAPRAFEDRLPSSPGRLIRLDRGDPDFSTPEYIVEAALRAMRDGYTHYPHRQGDPHLREAIATYQSRSSGVAVSASEVLVTNGSTGAICSAMMAVLDPGDEVIVLEPCYSHYCETAAMIGARVVFAPLTSDFRVDLDAVRRAVGPRTRMLVLNYPSNPTGMLLQQPELDGLATIAREHDLVVLSDEIYDQLLFRGRHISPFGHPALVDRTIVINSFSKSYAMTGWRLGWAAGRHRYLKAMMAINRTTTGTVNNITQRAGLAALASEAQSKEWHTYMLAQYRERRETILELLAGVPGVRVFEPDAAFYAWVRYEPRVPSLGMMRMLHARGLMVRPGAEFGPSGEYHLRFTFAPSMQTIAEGIRIFAKTMEESSIR